MPTERISYGVFIVDSFFLTNETNCSERAIGSLVLSVRANSSAVNLTDEVALSFHRLQKVGVACMVGVA